MKSKKIILSMSLALGLMLSMSVCAGAVDYSFSGVDAAEYYPSTSYEDRYGARYQYGSTNAVDYEIEQPAYGKSSSTSVGCMEKTAYLGQDSVVGSNVGSGIYSPSVPTTDLPSLVYPQTAYTSTADMERTDGSIGTVKISSLGINMKVYEGETNTSMAKGLGHFSSTSGWNGNVGVCGHNRGAKYVIGAIKHLEIGDKITYTTIYGTRTYAVTTVATISSTDWSYLSATADNRITLTTCLANQPNYRVCVQAVEVT